MAHRLGIEVDDALDLDEQLAVGCPRRPGNGKPSLIDRFGRASIETALGAEAVFPRAGSRMTGVGRRCR